MNAISGQPQPACQVWRARLLRPLAVWIRTALGLLLAATTGAAESPAQKPPGGLADMTIEQLMNEPVTAVSKKETKLSESPAAISVITQEDIRRSGLTSLPELLRTVPGLDVVRINASQWAVSSRGFNNQYANKLLVLVDGRAVYTNYWNSPVEGSGVLTARPFSLTPALSRWERIHGPSAAISAPEPVPATCSRRVAGSDVETPSNCSCPRTATTSRRHGFRGRAGVRESALDSPPARFIQSIAVVGITPLSLAGSFGTRKTSSWPTWTGSR